MECRPCDAEHRAAARPYPWREPRARSNRLQAESRLGSPSGHRVRCDGQQHGGGQGVLGPLLRGCGECVLHGGDTRHPGLHLHADQCRRQSRSDRNRDSGADYGISNDIKHPRTDEFNVSFETQVTRGLRFTATGIWRSTGNFVNNVIADARFTPVPLTNALTGETFTGYSWSNADTSNDSFLIRNTQGFQYIADDGSVIATADPHRDYKALMLVLSNSLRGRLGYQLSYVLAKADGNVDNSRFGDWLNGTAWDSPNTAIINADGELTNSRRHEIKAYVTYMVPRVEVMLGGIYNGLSGRPVHAVRAVQHCSIEPARPIAAPDLTSRLEGRKGTTTRTRSTSGPRRHSLFSRTGSGSLPTSPTSSTREA